MDRVIRTQVYRILFVYILMIGVCVWQTHFIMLGIESNPYLNLTIIGVFFLGTFIGVRSIASLTNEKLAFEALQEAYADTMKARHLREQDPLWRHHRCFEKAVVFKAPRILGHIFDLAIEEIMRARAMRISVETAQSILHVVDGKISTERSLLTYIPGLSVFLGLIGTFIGLMEMVGSVGGIIGGLARSDNASPDAIKQLIRDLEAPLIGMATGFSSSLFGLGGSLILGLLSRFTSQAAHAVRDDLENWLSGISQLADGEEGHAKGSSVATAPGVSSSELVQFAGMTVAVMGGVRRTNVALTRAADSIRLLADRQMEHSQLLSDVCNHVEHVASHQSEVRNALMRTTAMQADITALRGDVAKAAAQIEGRVSGGLTRVGEAVANGHAGVMASIGELTVRQADSLSQTLETGRRIEDSARRFELQSQHIVETQMRGFESVAGEVNVLHDSIGQLGRGLAVSDAAHGKAREYVEGSLARLQSMFTEASAQNRIGLQAVEAGLASVDQGLAKGFDQQAVAVQGVGREIGVISQRMSDVIALIDRDLAARSEESAQRSQSQNEALERVALHQAEIGKVLRILADSLNTDPSAMANGIKDAIGQGFQHVATSLDGTYGVLGQSLDRLATGQDAIAKAVERSAGGVALTAELREIGRSIERGIVTGFDEVTQSFENTFGSYSELVRSAQLELNSETLAVVVSDDELPLEPLPKDAGGMGSHLDELRRLASLRTAPAPAKN